MAMFDRVTGQLDEGVTFESNLKDAMFNNIYYYNEEKMKMLDEQLYGETLYDQEWLPYSPAAAIAQLQ